MKIGIIGLGYVGLPLARLMATKYDVVGYDIDATRRLSLRNGTDTTHEMTDEEMQALLDNPRFTIASSKRGLQDCTVYIVAVPTPVDVHHRPNLMPLLEASRLVGGLLRKDDVVIYESTVYPGVTEDVCVPELSAASGLQYNVDFFVGYSPERINPGDKKHRVENICKVTAGSTPATAEFVDTLYASVLEVETCPVSSIRIAEASKIIENTQRDVNIAFVNELAKIFNAMGIDTAEVLEAAATKWNFIPVTPGLVGGHCISIDPYYLIQNAQVHGILPRVISEARRINNSMGVYVANQVVALMNRKNVKVKDAAVLILGFAFKENCPDVRNTKVADVYSTLSEYTSNITIYDPHVNKDIVKKAYNIDVVSELPPQHKYEAIVLCVAHSEFLTLDMASLRKAKSVIYDVKSVLPTTQIDGRL